jgi:chorismate lyase/3-hydroxybenzoate synthase
MSVEDTVTRAAFETEFGHPAASLPGGARAALQLPLPVLGGDRGEQLFSESSPAGESHGFQLCESEGLLIGCSTERIGASMRAAGENLYRRLLGASRGRTLYRIWNYVPEINAERDGLENYRAFCAGRSQAFETIFGAGFKAALPSASAVGCSGAELVAIFVAGRSPARHLENPEQIAAYEYPPEHGPRPPSFSRATIASSAKRPLIFISGTAAIKGHATVAPGSLREQLDCTLDNLRLIGIASGAGESLGKPGGQRHFKIYIRHAADYPAVRARLERDLLRSGDRVIYLRADICRASLNLEIEATLAG